MAVFLPTFGRSSEGGPSGPASRGSWFNNLPKYLESSVGSVPERPSERAAWRQAVLAIEDYRDRYGIRDRNRALGGEPRNAEQRQEKEQLERDIDDRNERRHGRSRDDDFGIERGLEFSR